MRLSRQVVDDLAEEHQRHRVQRGVRRAGEHEGQEPERAERPAERLHVHRWVEPGRLRSPSQSRRVTRPVASTDFLLHQTVASESLSIDTFDYKNDVYVTIGAPSTDSCMVFQWDHIEMNFRTYDNITGRKLGSAGSAAAR